jgi:hypothetical protein
VSFDENSLPLATSPTMPSTRAVLTVYCERSVRLVAPISLRNSAVNTEMAAPMSLRLVLSREPAVVFCAT